MRKTILALVAMALLSGCTTNGQFDSAKTWVLVGAVVVGAVVASSTDSETIRDTPQGDPIRVP